MFSDPRCHILLPGIHRFIDILFLVSFTCSPALLLQILYESLDPLHALFGTGKVAFNKKSASSLKL